MATMTLSHVSYGPTEFYVRQGGDLFWSFDVGFSGTPPTSFRYTVTMRDPAQSTVKTVQATVQTNGQNPTSVFVTAPGTKDGGGLLPFEHLSQRFQLDQASGYDDVDKTECTGICSCPEPECECPDAQDCPT